MPDNRQIVVRRCGLLPESQSVNEDKHCGDIEDTSDAVDHALNLRLIGPRNRTVFLTGDSASG